ncbi:MAG: hypothetical protein ABIE70_02250 [bacterium]
MAPEIKPRRSRYVVVLLAVVFAVLSAIPCASEPFPRLVVRVSDTTASSGATSTVSVFLDNFQDTVVGFNLWLQLDRPDLMLYETSVDSIVDTSRWFCEEWDGLDCIDSLRVTDDTLYFQCNEWDAGLENCLDSSLIPLDSILYGGWDYDTFYVAVWDWVNIDTIEQQIGTYDVSGTLVENWDWVDARSISGYGTDLNVAGIADLPGLPHPAGIAPQQGGVLVKLQAQVQDVPDSLIDRTVNILIQSDFLAHFNFSGPGGTSIGLAYEEVPDTNCYVCVFWAGGVCLNWKRVSVPPMGGCDSTDIGLDTLISVDTSLVWLTDGSLTVLSIECGNIDGEGDGGPDIGDLVFLVNYMFNGGATPPAMWTADVNCDGSGNPDIGDLVYLVNYMFNGGPWCNCGP